MKKKKIVFFISFVMAMLVLYLSIFFAVAHITFQYYEGEKTFQKGGLSIVLNNEFKEKETSDYTAYYLSMEMMF